MTKSTRRSFLKRSAIAITGAGIFSSMPHNIFATGSPSDRINIALIGVGFGMGTLNNALSYPWVHCSALCDVNKERLEEQANNLKRRFPETTKNLKLYSDFRRLLDDKDIHGVIIATPDHWHTYMFAEACKSGKAVYIEKPTGHTIGDCHIMVEFQKKYKNIVSTGMWQTSQSFFREANKILKTGILGDVFKVQTWLSSNTNPSIFSLEHQPVPETFDYDMWLGPAPYRPYVSQRVRGWRSWWDYGGGQQTDWGVHWIDSAFDGLKALGHDRILPKAVFSVGYKHPGTVTETPRSQTSVFQYDDFHLVWEQQVSHLYNRNQGVAWIGSNGTLVCNRSGYELIPERRRDGHPVIPIAKMEGEYEEGGLYNHARNWVECIRDNNQITNSPIEKGSFATILCNMANISYRIGGASLNYLSNEQKFENNPLADSFIHSEYKNNWEYPRI